MKKLIFLTTATLMLLSTSCTTYVPGSTWLERVQARYEQNIILDDDPDLAWKICKHTLVDISTLGFAEIWYAKVRSSYKLVEKFRQAEAERVKAEELFKKKYTGKKRIDIIREFGNPDNTEPDGEGGKIMTYENAVNQSGILAPVYQNVLAANRNARDLHSRFVEQKRIWFALDKNNIVYAVGFRTKTDVQTFRVLHVEEKRSQNGSSEAR